MSWLRSIKEFLFTTQEHLIPFGTYLNVMFEVYNVKDQCDEWLRIDLSTLECLIAYTNKRYCIDANVPKHFRGLYHHNLIDFLMDVPVNSFEKAIQKEIIKCDLRYDVTVSEFNRATETFSMKFRDRYMILDDELSQALNI